ncbi:MAG TPA: helix-turn-helix domain-containing protein [Thermomicrobiales bacterium]|nr:helix-turn-helix domain-containing protein [Thermomicrobiales bacterium]
MNEQQNSEQLSARDLAEQAGTTVRTVHYYVSEGLLPPPEGSTRGAFYGPAHLGRLRLIAALRDEGLSLAAIRARLTPLTDDGVMGVLKTLETFKDSIEAGSVTALGLIEAAVADQVGEASSISGSLPDIQLSSMVMSAPSEEPPDSARSYVDRMLRRPGASSANMPAPAPYRVPAAVEPAPEIWHHFEIEDGIELRVSAEHMQRDRRRILSLVDSIRDLARQRGRRPRQ